MEARPARKKNRIEKYDYSRNGAYFITICTENRKCVLSRILPPHSQQTTPPTVGGGVLDAQTTPPTVGGGVLDAPYVRLTEYGRVVDMQIRTMNEIYPNVQAEKYVIMPNHVHLIICIRNPVGCTSGTSRTPSPTNAIIPSYVSTMKRMSNKVLGRNIWQRSFHDHVIRGEGDYQMIWQYIDANPALWEKDCFYTEE